MRLRRFSSSVGTTTAAAAAGSTPVRGPPQRRRTLPRDMPNIKEFLQGVRSREDALKDERVVDLGAMIDLPPYLPGMEQDKLRKVFIETYGCQMNVSDSEIVMSVLQGSGSFEVTSTEEEADVILLNTCAVREKAEQKIWSRLTELKKLKKVTKPHLTVGVLGCMAERLKTRLLEQDQLVDLVVGPDAYKTLPHLLRVVGEGQERDRIQAINVALSADETYADVNPVRHGSDGVSAFVSIMRGCNNMCSFCIVPHTRGRERSRPVDTVVREVQQLSEQRYREVVLLGQNVNVYNDLSGMEEGEEKEDNHHHHHQGLSDGFPLTPGFKSMTKIPGGGKNFVHLMDAVSRVDPEMRIRFTSPHPKAFPEELLHLIADRSNICKNLHVPAQSGSTSVLQRMRRNYSRDAYLDLIRRIRTIIPGVTLSTDLISGFCGETEEEHRETLSLLREVGFDQAFMFAYSKREPTHASRTMQDDVPAEVKQRRLSEVIETFHSVLQEKVRHEIGKKHVVLVEADSKRSAQEWQGRSDTNFRVVFPKPSSGGPLLKSGDYALVQIESASIITLRGKYLGNCTIDGKLKKT